MQREAWETARTLRLAEARRLSGVVSLMANPQGLWVVDLIVRQYVTTSIAQLAHGEEVLGRGSSRREDNCVQTRTDPEDILDSPR